MKLLLSSSMAILYRPRPPKLSIQVSQRVETDSLVEQNGRPICEIDEGKYVVERNCWALSKKEMDAKMPHSSRHSIFWLADVKLDLKMDVGTPERSQGVPEAMYDAERSELATTPCPALVDQLGADAWSPKDGGMVKVPRCRSSVGGLAMNLRFTSQSGCQVNRGTPCL